MRFASREKAILSHFEVGAGVVPGGAHGAAAASDGRGRALKCFWEPTISRATWPSATVTSTAHSRTPELDAFVESLATRIASFDKQALSETKRFADVASLRPTSKSRRSGTCASPRSDDRRATEDQAADRTRSSQTGRRGEPAWLHVGRLGVADS